MFLKFELIENALDLVKSDCLLGSKISAFLIKLKYYRKKTRFLFKFLFLLKILNDSQTQTYLILKIANTNMKLNQKIQCWTKEMRKILIHGMISLYVLIIFDKSKVRL